MKQLESQVAAAEVTLNVAVLDRIDKIVAPGTTINPVDNSFQTRRSSRPRDADSNMM